MTPPAARGQVQTVLGPVSPEALGPTLMHEHLLCDIRHPSERKPDGRKASKPASAPKETKASPPEASAETASPAPARAKAPAKRAKADSAPKSKTTGKAKPKSK